MTKIKIPKHKCKSTSCQHCGSTDKTWYVQTFANEFYTEKGQTYVKKGTPLIRIGMFLCAQCIPDMQKKQEHYAQINNDDNQNYTFKGDE